MTPPVVPFTNNPIIIGCDWSRSFHYAALSWKIESSTNATPIVITTQTPHTVTNSDYVKVTNHSTNNAANGVFAVTSVTDDTITLTSSNGNGVGNNVGQISKLQSGAGYTVTCELKTKGGATVIVSPTVTWTDQSKFEFRLSLTDTQTTALSSYAGVALLLVVKAVTGTTQSTLFTGSVLVKNI